MKKILFSALMAMSMLVGTTTFTACDNGDEFDTNQYTQPLSLLAFGPSPVARGGELRFIGTGLDQVTSVSIPGCSDITEITRISSEDIRITVPQEAQPGKVTLNTASEHLVSLTNLTFTEPVGFDEAGCFSPSTIKPGNELTIKGEYLNLVTAIMFTDKVTVEKANFSSHSRKEISLTVPVEAQTGKVALTFCATGDTIPNIIYSADELTIVLPAVAEVMDIKGSKPGDKITIKGTDLDLVQHVIMPNGDEVPFAFTGEDFADITFTLPANISTGYIRVAPASGVEVVVANNGVAEPADLVATPAKDIREGDIITITGKNLDIVTSINFPGVADAVALENGGTATKISVKAPAGFISGEMLLNTGYDVQFPVAIVTAKPELTAYNPTTAGAGKELTINGKNLDLIAKVTFTDNLAVTEFISQAADALVLTVPATAVEGELKITMKNGEEVQFASIQVDAPEFCFASQLPEEKTVKAGDIIIVTVVNGDKLVGTQIDGEDCQFILKGETLYIGTPYNAGTKSVLKLISSNGEIEYPISLIPNTEIVTTLWSGMAELGWSGEGQVYLGNDGGPELIAAEAKAGDILRIKFQPINDDWAIQIWEGHWGAQYDEIKAENYDLAGNDYYYNIVLTDELLKTFTKAQGWGGIVLTQGQNIFVVALELYQKISMETTIWEGSMPLGWSGEGQVYLGNDGGQQLIDNEAKPGSILRIYFEPTADDWAIQIWEGHWGTQYDEIKAENYDLAGHNYCYEIKLTEELLKTFTTAQGWGGIVLVQGQSINVVKLTVE